LVEGLESLSVREYVRHELVCEGHMVHLVDVFVVHRQAKRPRSEADRGAHASHQSLSLKVLLLCVVRLDVWLPHKLFQLLYLLAERSLVTPCAHDLIELELLLEGGPKVKLAIVLFMHSRVPVGLKHVQFLRRLSVNRLVDGLRWHIVVVVA